MLTINKKLEHGVTRIELAGKILQSNNFDQLFESLPPEMIVNCRQVSHINSAGIKDWISFFNSVRSLGTKLSFEECSPAVVFHINLICNFIHQEEVKSILLPFFCQKCEKDIYSLAKVADLAKNNCALPDVTCPDCKGKAQFDDNPKEYFSFLSR